MAKKSEKEESSESESKEAFNFDKALEGLCKDMKVASVSIQRDSFITNSVSSGVLVADLILGGGWPGGRFSIMVGPEGGGKSTFSFYGMREAIALGIPVLHFDYEGATDPTYTGRIGLKTDWEKEKTGKKPILYRNFTLDTGEESFNIMHRMLKQLPDASPGQPIQAMFTLDSLPAMLPQAIDENDESKGMAIQAAMFSKELKKVKTLLAKKNCILFGINQERERPGPSFGCLHGETLIRFVDGRVHTIKEIVDAKMEGEVYSMAGDGKIVPRRILNWFNNGASVADDWVTIKVNGEVSGSNGNYSITCTKDHQVYSQRGWVAAKDIELNDLLVSRYERKFNPGTTAEKFLLGVVVGDCNIPTNAGSYDRGILKFADNLNPQYVEWKVKKLSKLVEFSQYPFDKGSNPNEEPGHREGWVQYVSDVRVEFDQLKDLIPVRNPVGILDRMNILSLAVWYMDDGNHDTDNSHCRGSISIKRLKNDKSSQDTIENYFNSLGYECTMGSLARVNFTKSGFAKLSRDIRQFVPPCMQYKLREEDRGQYIDFDLDGGPAEQVQIKLPVKDVQHSLSKRRARTLKKYDLQIEGTANYLAGSARTGVIVHNSPLYEPCGNAPKQYSDVRANIHNMSIPKTPQAPSGAGTGKLQKEPSWDGKGNDVYRYSILKTVKHKMFSPFREAWVRFWFMESGKPGPGIDPVYDVFQYLVMTGQIEFLSKGRYDIKIPGSTLTGKTPNWATFKETILNPEAKKDKDSYLPNLCRTQLEEGAGFKLYYDVAGGVKEAADSEDGLENGEDIADHADA